MIGETMCGGLKNSVLSVLFLCKPKTAKKISILILKCCDRRMHKKEEHKQNN